METRLYIDGLISPEGEQALLECFLGEGFKRQLSRSEFQSWIENEAVKIFNQCYGSQMSAGLHVKFLGFHTVELPATIPLILTATALVDHGQAPDISRFRNNLEDQLRGFQSLRGAKVVITPISSQEAPSAPHRD